MRSRTAGLEPQYLRIRRQIESQIRRGELGQGARIPGERELARQFGVSQMTANHAIQELVRDGWLRRRAGSGTFVSRQDERSETASEQTIVLAIPYAGRPEHDVYLQVPFNAISGAVAATGHSLVVAQSADPCFSQVVEKHPHARFIFAAPNDHSRSALMDMHERGVPFVAMGASWPKAPFACVDTDNVAAEATAVAYVAHLGHRRIGFVNGPLVETNNRDRLEGYRQGMEAHSLPENRAWVVETGSNVDCEAASRQKLMDMLVCKEPVTSIICAGFSLTLNVLSLLRSLQLRVPDDVSIIGFDDPPAAEHLSPALTTLKQPLYELGQRALERVLDLAPGGSPGEDSVEYLPIELVLRASCVRRVD